MKSLMVLAAATLALSACGSSSSNSNNKGGGGGSQQENVQPLTTAADCGGPRTRSGLEGTWTSDFASSSFQLTMSMTFRNGTLTFRNTCTQAATSRASVSVPYQDTGSTIVTLGEDSDSQENGGVTCNASIKRGSMSYHFEGSCLVLQDPNSSDVIYMKSAY